MALTEEQHALRAARIGSSDAVRIMAGRWREVWCEKTGRAEPPSLDMVPAVQIGVATEALHPRFYSHRTGIECRPAGERSFVHPEHEFLVAHLDFLTWYAIPSDPEVPADTILEAKFHAGLKSDEELAQRYFWQLQHQMFVTGHRRAVLSVLRPSSYSFLPVDWDEDAVAALLTTLQAFWWHVENDVEPGADAFRVEAPDFEQLRVLNMARHNEFVALSMDLIASRAGAETFRRAEAALKALMPEHARIAYVPPDGPSSQGGVVLTRSRDGKLSLKFGALPKKHWDRAERWQPEPASATTDG